MRDNGVRSFVPPTFRFELVDVHDGTVVRTVSRVSLPSLGATDDGAVAELERRQLWAAGSVSEYDVEPAGQGVKGLAFDISRTVPAG